jgi:hypothetical protein
MGYGRTIGIVSPRRTSRARRRDCLGELVQIDGSEHAWLEYRGPPCTLPAFGDDAASRLMQLRFVRSDPRLLPGNLRHLISCAHARRRRDESNARLARCKTFAARLERNRRAWNGNTRCYDKQGLALLRITA